MSDHKDKKLDQLRPSSYDGIQEYDNDLPRWWVWLFYLTCVYAVVYVVGYYGMGITIPPVPHEPSGVIVAQSPAAKEETGVDETGIMKAMLKDPAVIEKGKVSFATRCAPCHGAAGGGLIGPNLTDDNWIHGGSLVQIKTVIENGVIEKGMTPWKAMLPQDDIRALVVYIRSLRGTNPAGAKAAQGEVYSGEDL